MPDPWSAGAFALGLLALAKTTIPKWIDAWKANRRAEVEARRVEEREATERRRLDVEEAGVAARVIERAAEDLRAKQEEHSAERAGHLACLERCAALERRVGEEVSARQALERAFVWLLELVGADHEPPPADVAMTIARIRPSLAPPPETPAE